MIIGLVLWGVLAVALGFIPLSALLFPSIFRWAERLEGRGQAAAVFLLIWGWCVMVVVGAILLRIGWIGAVAP